MEVVLKISSVVVPGVVKASSQEGCLLAVSHWTFLARYPPHFSSIDTNTMKRLDNSRLNIRWQAKRTHPSHR
eukprot:3892617-Amphidinium_carterae.1